MPNVWEKEAQLKTKSQNRTVNQISQCFSVCLSWNISTSFHNLASKSLLQFNFYSRAAWISVLDVHWRSKIWSVACTSTRKLQLNPWVPFYQFSYLFCEINTLCILINWYQYPINQQASSAMDSRFIYSPERPSFPFSWNKGFFCCNFNQNLILRFILN